MLRTVLSSSTSDIVIYITDTPWKIGDRTTSHLADGFCDSFVEITDTFLPRGTYLGNDGRCDYFMGDHGGFYATNCN
jgi:hypothetical protein